MILDELYESPRLCPECGGPAFSDLLLAEKKDACYNKVRSRYKVWPSAYASGALVQCRKKGAANWGNKSEGLVEDAGRAEAQAAYMQGECMILAVAINQLNPERYPIGYIWEYNMSAGVPDMQLDDDEWESLSPQEQQEISKDISRHSVVHAYVRDRDTGEYIDARGRHKTLPNLWGRLGQTRFEEFPGTARELIDITAYGDWDEVGEQVSFKRGQPAFDSLAGPAGVKRAQEYAVKYLGVEGRSEQGVAEGKKSTLDLEFRIRHKDNIINIYAELDGVMVGYAKFNVRDNTLVAGKVSVDPDYRRQGIATAIYNYAKDQGYTIIPSQSQTDLGREFWKDREAKKDMAEEQLDEKCWDTHRQAGMKKKGDRMVPNCVPKESVEEGEREFRGANGPVSVTTTPGRTVVKRKEWDDPKTGSLGNDGKFHDPDFAYFKSARNSDYDSGDYSNDRDLGEGDKIGNMDADQFDAAMSRLKKLAGQGPLKTVWDPEKRVYKNVPVAVQPKQQPSK